MYPDVILFIISAIFATAMIAFAISMVVLRKRSRAYSDLTEQEVDAFNSKSASLFSTRSSAMQSQQYQYPSHNSGLSEADTDETQLLTVSGDGKSSEMSGRPVEIDGFDPYSLADAYKIEREIGGGAMSRTFEVKSVKLGNNWFMKYIPSKYGRLASEVDILRHLNHASLPRIIDVFHKDEGDYLVETLVEGYPLKELISTGAKASQTIILDWFIQITQALSYLHNMNPTPIYHLDLKPGNIMVTHNNRLVLVDFGIARKEGDDGAAAFTVLYAAPEQFRGRALEKHAQIINERFGDISHIVNHAGVGAVSDVYSLGVIMFELATGVLPTLANVELIKKHVSPELSSIILRCLAINPAERYQAVNALLNELNNVKGTKFHTLKVMMTRKIAAVMTTLSLLISGGAFAGGFIIYNEESAAIISAEPELITVSLQQSSEFIISRKTAGGNVSLIDSGQIMWYLYDDNIARIDGNRISGINEGETIIRGQRRNKDVDLIVRVIKPVNGLIDVSQQYQLGRFVRLFAGDFSRTREDGGLQTASFISPESITAYDDGTVFVSDAGEIRMIKGSTVSAIAIPTDYLKASILGNFDNELYFLSQSWQDGERYYYAIVRLTDGNAEAIYIADARYSAIEDFEFNDKGILYFIDRNDGMGDIYLKSLSLYNIEDIITHTSLPAGSTSLTVDNNGYVYIGNKDLGQIQIYRNGQLEYFAGLDGERAFIDGASPRFYSPQRLEYSNGYLYVWDFNTLRRIETNNGVAGTCITIAGIAAPEFDPAPDAAGTQAEDVIFPFGSLMDFTVTGNGILLTDYKRSVIWEIE